MANCYIGEIRMFGGNFAPVGWFLCQGQLVPISQYDALFNLIGTTYGGDGVSTFSVPDLRGRLPACQGGSFVLGEQGGVESVTLTVDQLAGHTHTMLGSVDPATTSSSINAAPASLAAAGTASAYGIEEPFGTFAPDSIGPVGSGQPHENRQPILCVNFIIAYDGVYPSPT